jgi:hypothetical protein
VLQLLVTANVVPSSVILFSLMMEAMRSSEMLVLTIATRRRIPEDGMLHDISESEFCLHLPVKPTQLGLIDGATLCHWTEGDRIRSPKIRFSNKRQEDE